MLNRASINFSNKCNMACPFCYVPFKSHKIYKKNLLRIIDIINSFDTKIITFGGGDPFLYKDIYSIFGYAKSKGFFVHVDTNGLSINKKDLLLMSNYVDLISLPIEGININIRNHIGYFHQIENLIGSISELNTRLKINTLVTSKNINEVLLIAEFLKKKKIDIWSIYQFWPLHDAFDVKDEYFINNQLYNNLINKIQIIDFDFIVEYNKYEERPNSSYFINTNGDLYLNDIENIFKYRFIGNILMDKIEPNFFCINENYFNKILKTRYSK
jgi:MoaA/NifB/PqqE/SkfB family radical SAM enzyme